MLRSSNRHAQTFAALAPLRARLAAHDDDVMRTQVTVAEVPAPTGDEGARAAWLRDRFAAPGLAGVRIDEAGNVIGRRPGRRDDRPVVVCAHLDTVFPRETVLTVRRDGRRFFGPGITDNGRGLAAMLAIAECLDPRHIPLEHPVEFLGSTGEEGNGALRGAKHYFARAGERPRAPRVPPPAGGARPASA